MTTNIDNTFKKVDGKTTVMSSNFNTNHIKHVG
jgi:hypothetical protein